MARSTVHLLLVAAALLATAALAQPTRPPTPTPPYTAIVQPGYCAWYGECGFKVDGTPLNCLYNGPARAFVRAAARATA